MLDPTDDLPTRNELLNLNKDKKNEFIKKGNIYLENNKKGIGNQMSIFNTYKQKNSDYINKEKFFEKNDLDLNKPLVVIMAHCFSDFPNYYGPAWYTDYVEWISFTLKIISNINSCNWTLKPHPAEIGLGNARLKKIFHEGVIPPNVKYWPDNASSTETFEFADIIITARGSSTLLYGAEKKVLAAEKSIYTQFKVCNYVSSREDYENKLKNIKLIIKNDFDFSDSDLVKMFFAISHFENKNELSFPYGFLSQKLYKNINKFINNNLTKIKHETKQIKLWERTGHDRFNTYKRIYD